MVHIYTRVCIYTDAKIYFRLNNIETNRTVTLRFSQFFARNKKKKNRKIIIEHYSHAIIE